MSENSMMERVARALMDVRARRPGSGKNSTEFPVLDMDSDFDDLPSDSSEGTDEDPITQEAVLKLARAAIEAIRKPTEAMFGGQYGVEARRQFTDMLNAALSTPNTDKS